jgi:hypothetical protein
MNWDEREEYGEEARDAIEGLRRLAHRAESPPGLRAEVMARAERLLPPRRAGRARWWTMLCSWRPHPLAWGPVVAGAFFVAGMLVPWSRPGMPPDPLVSEERPTLGMQRPLTEPTEVTPASPTMPTQPWSEETRPHMPPAPFSAMARRESLHAPSPAQREVTAVLPSALYEELQREAQRRQITMAAILREAAEAYAQAHRRPH